jgi:hypothetical protein
MFLQLGSSEDGPSFDGKSPLSTAESPSRMVALLLSSHERVVPCLVIFCGSVDVALGELNGSAM